MRTQFHALWSEPGEPQLGLADDPLRAVAATPGGSSNDDFSTTLAIREADPARVGIYLDGVPLHNALHNLEGTDLLGSTSVFNPALIHR